MSTIPLQNGRVEVSVVAGLTRFAFTIDFMPLRIAALTPAQRLALLLVLSRQRGATQLGLNLRAYRQFGTTNLLIEDLCSPQDYVLRMNLAQRDQLIDALAYRKALLHVC